MGRTVDQRLEGSRLGEAVNRSKSWKIVRMGFTVVVVAACLGIAAVLLVAPRLVNGASLAVRTGSMSPAIPAGSLVLVEPVAPGEVRPGDVITFQVRPGEATYVTHRVVRVEGDPGGRFFVTKGDANAGEDLDPVPEGALRGRVILHVPYLGRFSEGLSGRALAGLTVAGLGASLLLDALRTVRRERIERCTAIDDVTGAAS